MVHRCPIHVGLVENRRRPKETDGDRRAPKETEGDQKETEGDQKRTEGDQKETEGNQLLYDIDICCGAGRFR